jgi:hypothetical protein
MKVLVEELDEAGLEAGLTTRAIRTRVELELRRSGINVISRGDRMDPALYVRVSVRTTKATGLAYRCEVQLREWGIVMRDSPSLFWRDGILVDSIGVHDFLRASYDHAKRVSTWDRGLLGTTPQSGAADWILRSMQRVLDEFMNEYLAANPRR